ncbi:MAG: hypothetical protein N4A63_17215 [Vallitalea sp.]|jgi:CBS domain containing-hemolysin-like protein|nr:hypothetical protein [Vallitalea sp.]
MKQKLRNYISKAASYSEITISFFTLLGIVILSTIVLRDIYNIIISILNGDFNVSVKYFLSHALQLIIGIEFIKMLVKHTPSSAIEVLLFAIARKMIIEENTMFDILLGVISIAILFIVRKYFAYKSYESNNGILVNGGTSVYEVNDMAKTCISAKHGKTIAGAAYNQLFNEKKNISAGSKVVINDAELEIYSMDGDLIKQMLVRKK